jgi:hypothetical protein
VDQRFEQYIRKRFGDAAIGNMIPRVRNAMMSSWERDVKLRFGNTIGSESFEVFVGLPDSKEHNIEGSFHSMEMYVIMCCPLVHSQSSELIIMVVSFSKDVQAIFDPVVDCIAKLVDQQYREVEGRGKSVAVSPMSIGKRNIF